MPQLNILMSESFRLENMQDKNNEIQTVGKKRSAKDWLRKVGVAGFLFFFIKGLVWIFLFVQAGKCAIG